jgi:hypothetical protein
MVEGVVIVVEDDDLPVAADAGARSGRTGALDRLS